MIFIKIEKLLNHDGFRLTFETDVSFKPDGSDFTINQSGSFFSFNTVILDDKTLELYLTDNPLLPPESQLVFDKAGIFTLTSTLVLYPFINDYVYDEIPLVGSGVDSVGGILTPVEKDFFPFTFSTVQNDETIGLFIEISSNFAELKEYFSIILDEYTMHNYKDFKEKRYTLDLTTIEYDNGFFIPFEFKRDKIYSIAVFLNNETGGYKPTKKVQEFIPLKPTYYLSSSFHITNLLEELELTVSVFNDFEAVFQIWKYSQIAFSKSGLAVSTLPLLGDYELTVFANYIAYKIILQKFLATYLEAYVKTIGGSTQGVKSIRLGDFETGNISTSVDTVNALRSLLKTAEEEIKEISQRRAFGAFKGSRFRETRRDLIFPYKEVMISNKANSNFRRSW